jgi:heat shock protein HslJ
MKTLFLSVTTAALLMACGPKGETTDKKKVDSLSTAVDTKATQPALEEVLLTAHGSKPNWTLSITKTIIKFKLEGRDTVTASDYMMADNSTPELAYYNAGKDFAITVEDKPAKDAINNVTYAKSVSISFQGKKYNGTGGEVVKAEAIKIAEPEIKKETVKKDETQGRITVNGKWFLQTLNGRKVTDADFTKGLATIDLDPTANRVSGFGGCNSINGTLTIYDGKKIKMEKIISTKMFCEGVPENEYLTALRSSTNFSVVDNKLQLKDNTGMVLAVFVRGIK